MKKKAAAPAAKATEEPTRIVVHIKADQEDKPEAAKPAKKEATASSAALLEKFDNQAPAFSSRALPSISLDDNDDFQGSVVEFENSVASSKQMIDDKLSGADKIRLPSSEDDDSLVQIKKKGRSTSQKSSRYLIGSIWWYT